MSTYLRCAYEQVSVRSDVVDALDPLAHLTDAFDVLERKPFKVNIIHGRALEKDSDLTSRATTVTIYEAKPITPEDKPHNVILRQLSDEKLVCVLRKALDSDDLKPIGIVLIELSRRAQCVIPEDLLSRLAEAFPAKGARPGYIRGCLARYMLTRGRGTRDLALEAAQTPSAAEAVAAFVLAESQKEGFNAEEYDLVRYFGANLRTPGVAEALVLLVRDGDRAKALHDYALLMCQLVAEGQDVDILLELIHWSALSCPETQTILLAKIPIFTAMVETHRQSAMRAIIGIVFNNPTACNHLRAIGLPQLGAEDLEAARIYELVSVMDDSAAAEVRTHIDSLWNVVENTTSSDILAAILHTLGVVLVDEADQLVAEFHEKSITDGWTQKTVATVKQHPFSESVQQFGIELLTLLGTIDPEGLLKSGAHVLVRMASNEYPSNDSIRTSHKWLAEVASGSDEQARQAYT